MRKRSILRLSYLTQRETPKLWLPCDLNHFVLSFPPLRIILSIYYFVEINSLNVNTSSKQRKHLIMGLKEIHSIPGSVKLFFLFSV